MESMHNQQDVNTKYCQDITAIQAVHKKFDFAADYLPVFVCIHICTPDHFRKMCLLRRDSRLIFNSLNHTSYAKLMESIHNLKHSAVRKALLNVCDLNLLQVIFSNTQPEVDDVIALQLKNMEYLYSRRNFREHMLTLYTYFIQNFLDDFK